MKNLIFILAVFTLISVSCSVECEKNLSGTIIDAMTEEALSDIPITVVGREDSRSGIGARFKDFDFISDNNGNFELNTRWGANAWDAFEVDSEDYKLVDLEFATDKRETCGENHVQVSLHRLSYVEFTVFDDPDIQSKQVNVSTSFRTNKTLTKVLVGETLIVPVLEEIPNLILLMHFDEDGFSHRDTITVEVPRGEVLSLNYGI